MPTTDNVNDVTMGLVGDISDIIPENSQQINQNKKGTPGFKGVINFYDGNSEDMSMLKDMNSQRDE